MGKRGQRTRRGRWAGAIALAMLTLPLAACPLFDSPTKTQPTSPPADDVPSIDTLEALPRQLATADEELTITATASDPLKRTLKFSWTATRGKLSAKTGKTVTWKALNLDGTPLTRGLAQVSLTVSNGKNEFTRHVNLRVGGDGTASVVSAGGVPTTVVTPGPSALPSGAVPSPGASGTASACRVSEVTPSLAAPGTIVYVRGTGFTGDATVMVGTAKATVLNVEDTRITARLPFDIPITDAALPVEVTVCGVKQTPLGTITIANTDTFGGNVTAPLQGLVATVFKLDEGLESFPSDFETRVPHAVFLARDLDVAPRAFQTGFPGDGGPLSTWFGIRFTGQIAAPKAGFYRFTLSSDDGSQLFIDNKLVVDNSGIHPPTDKTGEVELTAGKHRIKVNYMQGGDNQVALQLYWAPPVAAEAIVPETSLSIE